MKNKLSFYGIIILIGLFVAFYFIASLFLEHMRHDEEINEENMAITENDKNYNDEIEIVNNLYQNVRILYDVVNSKFKVDQDDIIVINDITYKKITNFDEVTSNLFTLNGLNKYISDLGSYFAITNDLYYLAGNLVSYQTYYFRGDDTKIYILDVSDNVINAIIYEKWTSNNKNTLATIRVIKEEKSWLIDDISILVSE
ncbi:MAG: hypothetical protein IJE89_05595 [Bacilli bacterium]|nr:hypothetical protein [Bacilli bacterium]